MNIDNSTLRDLQLVLDNLESYYRINNQASQQIANSDFMQGVYWGMNHANSSYEMPIKKLRSIIEVMGKGNLYLIEDVRLDGGEDHATA